MNCPYCNHEDSRVMDTSHDQHGSAVRRRRQCRSCGLRFTTYERISLSIPLLIKRDGTREEYSRDKLMAGIRLACSKRPISAEQIEQLIHEIESELVLIGKPEISSRVIGDSVIQKLRAVDGVAYLRYAIVYLPLNNLDAIQDEINRYFADVQIYQ